MKNIIILTGDEVRHKYFRIMLAKNKNINVLKSYCEDDSKSLENRVFTNYQSSALEKLHVISRKQSEKDYFLDAYENIKDKSKPKIIEKGSINNNEITNNIIDLNPDLIICYGSSLIKSDLLEIYKNKFLNVHLGLSPYYRGSGTNVWPLINYEPHMVGATFMYIDKGIDTGKIIHQIRAKIQLGDNPHTIGNRLIKDMVITYINIINYFDSLQAEEQPKNIGKFYKKSDFIENSCKILYKNISSNMLEDYINVSKNNDYPYIVNNKALSTLK